MTALGTERCSGGGHVVAALEAAGVRRAFGLPGVHALGIFDALRESRIEVVAGRTELAAAFSAEGHARLTGEPTPLLLSTGPGTLMSLGGVLESASAHTPVVVLSSQIRRDDIGRRRGALHEIPDQLASVRPLVKWARRALAVEQVPALVEEALAVATRPPTGPVYLELPVDVIEAAGVAAGPAAPARPAASEPAPALDEAVAALDAARRPLVWGGGGVVRGGAWDALRALAERLDSPVATTYMGKGGIDARHPLHAGSACEEQALQKLIAGADVVLAVGTELGAETTAQWQLAFGGTLIQVDASAERIGTTYDALPLVGDAGAVLPAIASRVRAREPGDGAERAARARDCVRVSLERGDRRALALLERIRAAVPWDAPTAWDMTILGYWAASAFPVAAGRTWLYPLGSGTLGYALPAALGASASGRRSFAVSGDGGAMYGLSELAVLAQHDLPVTWLIVDDGGYGVLRHYQEGAYAGTFAVDLARPDFAATARAAGIPARRTDPDGLGDALAETLASGGPAVVVLDAVIEPPPGLA